MALPKLKTKFIVRCDASNVRLGPVLPQEDFGGIQRPITYETENSYHVKQTTELSNANVSHLFGPLKNFNYIYIYIYERKFILETDHRFLQYLKTFSG